MPRYRVTKYITAKNVKAALRAESTADVDEISKVEPSSDKAKEEEGSANTHAIGFHIPPDYLQEEVAPENP